MTDEGSTQLRHRSRLFAIALVLALAVAACGGSSGEEGPAAAGDNGDPNEVVDETATTVGSSGGGGVEQGPVESDLASVPLLAPVLEIDTGATDQLTALALSPDGDLLAVLGGGPFTDVDIFLKIYDTTSGELTNEISFEGDAGPSVDRIYWAADNRLIGLDVVATNPRVVTWDGATFEFAGSFIMDEFVCLYGTEGFDAIGGAIFAVETMDDGSTLCRRDLASDTVLELRPMADGREVESLELRSDNSELVAEVWDQNAQQYLMVKFDPVTLEVLDETVLDPNRLVGVGVDVELIESSDFAMSLQPSGVVVPSRLKRPRFSSDGSLLWAVIDDTEVLIDVSTGEAIARFEQGRGHLFYAWSTDASVLVNPTLGTTLQVFRP